MWCLEYLYILYLHFSIRGQEILVDHLERGREVGERTGRGGREGEGEGEKEKGGGRRKENF